MRITCPSCAAEYDVPATITPGRKVRCAKCGNQWAPVEPEPEPEPAIVETVEEPAAEAPPEPTVAPPTPLVSRDKLPPNNRLALLLGWAGSFVVIAGLIVAALVWRDPVMQAWPPSIRVYAALGLTAHP